MESNAKYYIPSEKSMAVFNAETQAPTQASPESGHENNANASNTSNDAVDPGPAPAGARDGQDSVDAQKADESLADAKCKNDAIKEAHEANLAKIASLKKEIAKLQDNCRKTEKDLRNSQCIRALERNARKQAYDEWEKSHPSYYLPNNRKYHTLVDFLDV